MKTMIRLLPHILLVALLSVIAGACSTDDAAPDAVPQDDTQVSFILSLGDASTRTRATWNDPYDCMDGVDYDRRIDPDMLYAAIYDATNDNLAATVDILSYHETTTEGEYEFIGSVTPADGVGFNMKGTYKLMVFANCDEPDYENLSSFEYSYAPDEVKSGSRLIPMWGVATVELDLEKGKRQTLDDPIDLLRAFAKVEILLSEEITNTYTITNATLTKYNGKGYCLPAGYLDVANTRELDRETGDNSSFKPLSSLAEGLDLYVPEEGKTACLYIPEYANGTDAAAISLTLTGANNEEISGNLEFKDYTTNVPHDIVRNHIYRYTVTVEQGKLKVECKVLPWQLVETSIGWKPQPITAIPDPFESDKTYDDMLAGAYYMLFPRLGYSENLNTTRKVFDRIYDDPQEGDPEALLCFVCRPGYVVGDSYHQEFLKPGSGGARYYFMLTGPEGATWEAHLTNTEDFSFSTTYEENEFEYSEYDKGIFKVTHGIARSKPYIIQIIANNNYTGTEKGQTGLETEIPEYPDDNKGGEEYFKDEYLTEWGAKNWYGQKVIDTEFYITVKLTDGTEYELEINPSFKGCGKLTEDDFYYEDYRRYAGTGTRIWMRQLRAVYEGDFKEMAQDVSPTASDFAWWRVNPYWK